MESAALFDQAEKVTNDYAAYARESSGLGNVVGAVLVFITASLPQSMLGNWWTRILLGIAPFCWVIVKEQLRARYYRQFGYVEPRTGLGERLYSVLMVSFAVFISLLSMAILFAQRQGITLSLILSIFVLIAIPFIAYRFMRGKYEFITGCFLVFQAASALSSSAGFASLRGFLLLPAVIVAFIMLVAGIDQHRNFQKLKKVLTATQEDGNGRG